MTGFLAVGAVAMSSAGEPVSRPAMLWVQQGEALRDQPARSGGGMPDEPLQPRSAHCFFAHCMT